MGFPRQEYWSGLLFPSPGDLPDPGIEPMFPALQADSLPSETPGKPHYDQECNGTQLLAPDPQRAGFATGSEAEAVKGRGGRLEDGFSPRGSGFIPDGTAVWSSSLTEQCSTAQRKQSKLICDLSGAHGHGKVFFFFAKN